MLAGWLVGGCCYCCWWMYKCRGTAMCYETAGNRKFYTLIFYTVYNIEM